MIIVCCVFLCAGEMPTPRQSPVEEREVLSGEGRSNNNNMATDATTTNLLASVKEQVCRTVSICQCLAVGYVIWIAAQTWVATDCRCIKSTFCSLVKSHICIINSWVGKTRFEDTNSWSTLNFRADNLVSTVYSVVLFYFNFIFIMSSSYLFKNKILIYQFPHIWIWELIKSSFFKLFIYYSISIFITNLFILRFTWNFRVRFIKLLILFYSVYYHVYYKSIWVLFIIYLNLSANLFKTRFLFSIGLHWIWGLFLVTVLLYFILLTKIC